MAYKKYKVFMLLISIFLLILIGVYANPIKLIEILSKSDLLLILLAFAISNIAMILRTYRWKILLKNVGFCVLFPIQMIGLAIGNFTPGKLSDPIKSVILKPIKKIRIASSLPSIIWERVFDILSLILLSIFAIQVMGSEFNILLLTVAGMLIFFILVVLLVLILYKRSFGLRIVGIISRFRDIKKIGKKFLNSFYKQKISKPRLVSSFVITFITWTIEGVILYFVLLAMGVGMNVLLLIGITSLSFTIGIASTLPGGLGSTEVIMAMLLGAMGVPGEIAIAGVLVSRFLSFWYASILGAVSFFILSKRIELDDIKIVS